MFALRSGFRRPEPVFSLESFIYVEYEPVLSLSESVVQSHVNPFFEFPTVTYAEIRQGMGKFEIIEIAEYVPGSGPYHDAVAPPYVLAQLDLRFHEVFIAVASFVIASHAVRSAEIGHHGPGHVAVVELRVAVDGYHASFPYFLYSLELASFLPFS